MHLSKAFQEMRWYGQEASGFYPQGAHSPGKDYGSGQTDQPSTTLFGEMVIQVCQEVIEVGGTFNDLVVMINGQICVLSREDQLSVNAGSYI